MSRGLAVFSSADGHVIRTLTRDRRFPVAVGTSPNGRWVYLFRGSDLAAELGHLMTGTSQLR